MRNSRYVNVGLFYLRQLFFANFDLKVHTDAHAQDYSELWSTLRERISLVKGGAVTPGQATFGHLTSGYDAGYYGYTYSLVFAADMYKTVFKSDPLDPSKGRHYRETILLPGGSREESLSLEVSVNLPQMVVMWVTDERWSIRNSWGARRTWMLSWRACSGRRARGYEMNTVMLTLLSTHIDACNLFRTELAYLTLLCRCFCLCQFYVGKFPRVGQVYHGRFSVGGQSRKHKHDSNKAWPWRWSVHPS